MIPLSLSIKNFLSYGSQIQTINLEPYHLICLSGKNGHGKSALLDAITWALWGHARKLAGGSNKADNNLVRLGQSHMVVSLDFSANGMTYRVRREYVVTNNKAVSHLDFGILDTSSQKYHSLTDKTIRQTQEKITRAVGLGFESFINSVFLRQGQSNEFSKKAPRDRKEILATILGLDRYEELRKKASDHARLLIQEYDLLIKNIEREKNEIAQKETLQRELKTITDSCTTLLEQQAEIEKKIKKSELERKDIQEKFQQYSDLILKLEQTILQEMSLVSQLKEKIAVWRLVHRETYNENRNNDLIVQLKDIEQELLHRQQQLEQKNNIQERHSELTTRAQKKLLVLVETHTQLIQKRAQAITAAKTKKNSLVEQKKQLVTHRDYAENELKKIHEELHSLKMSHGTLEKTLIQLQREEKRFERRKQYYHKFKAHHSFLQKKIDELTHQHTILQGSDPYCINCKQAVHDSLLENHIIKQTHRYQYQKNRLEKILTQLKVQLQIDYTTLTHLKKYHHEYTTTTARISDLTTLYDKTKKQYNDLYGQYTLLISEEKNNEHILQTLLQEPEPSLEDLQKKDMEYSQMQTHLHLIEKEVREMHKIEAEYQALLKKKTELTSSLHQYHELLHNLSQQSQRKQDIHELVVKIRELRTQKNIFSIEKNKYSSLEKEKMLHEEEYIRLSQDLKSIFSTKEQIMHKKGALEYQVAALQQKEESLKTWRQKSVTLDADKMDFTILSHALSKDGIQALLIEEAIPEIEQEANTLLSLLTDNQAQLSIESLRDLKSGGVKETLDINISDSLGIRPYELFSGGEAFRIDFALRIAISKLLARRAGTSLQTLIIDEGFGSQDEEGLAHIMDALYKIQNHFAKIIVVSHLSSMKDQFPVHLIVQKMPHGSTVSIFEQG